MRVFKTKEFDRLSKRTPVTDADLLQAVAHVQDGLVAAKLGKFLLKLRVARPGGGRSGGFRVIVVYKNGERALFVHMFGKNEKSNLSGRELKTYRSVAKRVADLGEDDLKQLLKLNEWFEVCHVFSWQEADKPGDEVPPPSGEGASQGRGD